MRPGRKQKNPKLRQVGHLGGATSLAAGWGSQGQGLIPYFLTTERLFGIFISHFTQMELEGDSVWVRRAGGPRWRGGSPKFQGRGNVEGGSECPRNV